MPTLFSKIALTDANDLSQTEVIANVSEGLDGSTSFGYSNEYEKLSILDMQQINHKVTHTIEVIGLPDANISLSTLDHFVDPATDTLIALIGPDLSLIAQEPVKLEWVRKYTGGTAWKLKATFQTVPYREEDTKRKGGGLHVGKNILQLYSFTDVNSDGVANGFQSSTFSTESFAGGEQTLTDTTTGGEQVFGFEKLFFPFEGDQLTFSANIVSLTTAGRQLSLQLRYFDSTDSPLSSDETLFSSTGRKQVNSVIPSGAVYVRPEVVSTESGSASGTTDITFSEPSLRVDGKATFTEY